MIKSFAFVAHYNLNSIVYFAFFPANLHDLTSASIFQKR